MEKIAIVVLLAVFCSALAQFNNREGCGECDQSSCSVPKKCLAGIVFDGCGCCEICAKSQHQHCQHPSSPVINGLGWGQCGDNLVCELRDDLEEGDLPEALCQCRLQGVLCGSDGVTYENLCELSEAANEKGMRISAQSKKPCLAAPWMVSPPKNTKDVVGASIALICEAKGYPIPTIEWTWTRVDGKTVYLPSDDLHISVNMRGGPEKQQVTGWLQIFEMKKTHEGDYTCISQNQQGMVNATARVNVVVKGEEKTRGKPNW